MFYHLNFKFNFEYGSKSPKPIIIKIHDNISNKKITNIHRMKSFNKDKNPDN